MTKLDLALNRLKALPPERQEEIIDMLVEAVDDTPPASLTDAEIAEIKRRRDARQPGVAHEAVVAMKARRWP